MHKQKPAGLTLIAALCAILWGCAQHPVAPLDQFNSYDKTGTSRPLTEAQATRIAVAEAVRRQYDPARYKITVRHTEGQTWFVHFDELTEPGVAPAIGSDFAISIDEDTGETFYSPGR